MSGLGFSQSDGKKVRHAIREHGHGKGRVCSPPGASHTLQRTGECNSGGGGGGGEELDHMHSNHRKVSVSSSISLMRLFAHLLGLCED